MATSWSRESLDISTVKGTVQQVVLMCRQGSWSLGCCTAGRRVPSTCGSRPFRYLLCEESIQRWAIHPTFPRTCVRGYVIIWQL